MHGRGRLQFNEYNALGCVSAGVDFEDDDDDDGVGDPDLLTVLYPASRSRPPHLAGPYLSISESCSDSARLSNRKYLHLCTVLCYIIRHVFHRLPSLLL